MLESIKGLNLHNIESCCIFFFLSDLCNCPTLLAPSTNSPFTNIISANPTSAACLAPRSILGALLHHVWISIHRVS